MQRRYRSDSGQAAVLMALALVGLIGFAALAIDGGRLYTRKRHAQNAVDNAALAAGRAMCLGSDMTSAALLLTGENGYDNDGVEDIVTVNNPPAAGPYIGNPDYVEVIIVANFPGTLIQFFREGGLQVTVRAVSRCQHGVGQGEAAVFAMSQTCNNALLWAGAFITVNGGLHSNNDMQVTGSGNVINGLAGYVTSIDADPDKITFNPPPPYNPVRSGVLHDFLGFHLQGYAPDGVKAVIAQTAGRYHYCDCDIDMNWLKSNGFYNHSTRLISDGLYYSTGNIHIVGPSLIGNAVTFVAEGEIDFTGPGQELSAYIDGLLAFAGMSYENDSTACNTPVIKLSHGGGVYEGYFYGPHGHINLSASNLQITGGVVGYAISLEGANITVINESNFVPPPPGTFHITE